MSLVARGLTGVCNASQSGCWPADVQGTQSDVLTGCRVCSIVIVTWERVRTDPTGDIFIGEFQAVPDKPGIWTFLSGTGKWQGIKGGGEFHPVSRGKDFPDGTIAFCNGHSGKYTLP
jgi:hypothetical protein